MTNVLKKAILLLLSICLIVSNLSFSDITTVYGEETESHWSYKYENGTGKYDNKTITFEAPTTGKYLFKLYGASGQGANTTDGGKGGFTTAYVDMRKGEKVYITLGGQGANSRGGYNGGGSGGYAGGGATCVTTSNRGVLSNYANYKNEVLLVAGGGGGNSSSHSGILPYAGDGGGEIGGGIGYYHGSGSVPSGYKIATQTSGYAFGQGGNAPSSGAGAGGGGLFGGSGACASNQGGLGGSGYIAVDERISEGVTTTSSYIGGGFVTIDRYVKYVNVAVEMGESGSVNGASRYIFTGTAESVQKILYTIKQGATLDSFRTVSGDAELLSDGTLKLGMHDSIIRAQYKGKLVLSSSVNPNTYQIHLDYKEDDAFSKYYFIYQSTDKDHWSSVSNSSDGVVEELHNEYYYYKGYVESFIAPMSGDYTIEVYGASGGNSYAQGNYKYTGGKGGYAKGVKFLQGGTPIYICVGGAGGCNYGRDTAGGYNGGGKGTDDHYDDETAGSGGGCTSVTLTNRGTLSEFNAYRNEVLIVAGGGGGGVYGSGYGYAGSGGGTQGGASGMGKVATQTEGYAFGYGRSAEGLGYGDSDGTGGGGGGWYGGWTDDNSTRNQGGGGSGYVGGMDYNKLMTNGVNSGNGYAHIQYTLARHTATSVDIYDAKDKASPNKPSNGYVDKLATLVQWQNNGDNGTTYYHKVESYNAANNSRLAVSNVTEDTILSGVLGWYYYIDGNATGTVTVANSTFTRNAYANFEQLNRRQWIHIACVDNVGNLSETYNYELPAMAEYTVNHYQETDYVDTYVLSDSEFFTAKPDTYVTPSTKMYKGYIAPTKQTVRVSENNDTVINYYYKAVAYNIYYNKGLTDDNTSIAVHGATRNTTLQTKATTNLPYTSTHYNMYVTFADIGNLQITEKEEGNKKSYIANSLLKGRSWDIIYDANIPNNVTKNVTESYSLYGYELTGNLPSKGYWLMQGYDSDKVYNTELKYHKHIGDYLLGTGCYNIPVYHQHTKDCKTSHIHLGNILNGGPCYKAVNHKHTEECYKQMYKTHTHTGSPIGGTGCYTNPVYHEHIDSCYESVWKKHVHIGTPTKLGGCYTSPIYHIHKGNSTNGGNCYQTKVYKKHTHDGNSTDGGACYQTKVYKKHTHTDSCYPKYTNIASEEGVLQTKSESLGTATDYSTTICGKIAGQRYVSEGLDYYELSCGKTEGTRYVSEGIDHYDLSCGKTTSNIDSYGLTCGKTAGQRYESEGLDYMQLTCYYKNYTSLEEVEGNIEYYKPSCNKTEGEMYEDEGLGNKVLICGKNENVVDGFVLDCNKTIDYNCGKTEYTADYYLLGCGKTEQDLEDTIDISLTPPMGATLYQPNYTQYAR